MATLTASTTAIVADQAAVTASASTVVQPPVGATATGRGRLVHPTLGVYDYANTPDETVNIDGDLWFPPIWAHSTTLGGGVDVLWPGFARDVVVVERWKQGDVGCPIEHLRALWALYANPPNPQAGSFVVWSPNYASAKSWRVALVKLSAGGDEGITLDRRLLKSGYAPGPVELHLRIIGDAT